MNIQAMMKQAQKLQSDMLKEKKNIDEEIFQITKSFVTIEATGNKKINSIKIDIEQLTNDDKEMIEDMVVVAINEIMDKIDAETEKRMGKFSSGMPGLF